MDLAVPLAIPLAFGVVLLGLPLLHIAVGVGHVLRAYISYLEG